MNTVGKILVVLNLLFAVVTGGLLIFDWAGRTNWRTEAENRERVAKVAQASAKAYHDLAIAEINKRKRVEGDFDEYKIKAESDKGALTSQLADIARQRDDLKKQADDRAIEVEKMTKEVERLRKEVAHLNGVVDEREKQIVVTQGLEQKARIEAQTQKQIADAALGRAKNLLEQLREKELALLKLQGGGQTAGTASINNPNYQNPPPAYVTGTISKVFPQDKNLIQVTVGSDVGVRENHTLEIYRLKPRPEYLGRLLVVESHQRYALGRLIRTATQGPIQEGDEVASKLRRD